MNNYVILSEGKDATVLVLDKDGTYKRMVTFHHDTWEFPADSASEYIEQRKEYLKKVSAKFWESVEVVGFRKDNKHG